MDEFQKNWRTPSEWSDPKNLQGPTEKVERDRTTIEPARKNKGGHPDDWDWFGLKAIKEEKEKALGHPIRFVSRKDAEKWIASNVKWLEGTSKKPPKLSTIRSAIKRLQLDVLLGFSNLS